MNYGYEILDERTLEPLYPTIGPEAPEYDILDEETLQPIKGPEFPLPPISPPKFETAPPTTTAVETNISELQNKLKDTEEKKFLREQDLWRFEQTPSKWGLEAQQAQKTNLQIEIGEYDKQIKSYQIELDNLKKQSQQPAAIPTEYAAPDYMQGMYPEVGAPEEEVVDPDLPPFFQTEKDPRKRAEAISIVPEKEREGLIEKFSKNEQKAIREELKEVYDLASRTVPIIGPLTMIAGNILKGTGETLDIKHPDESDIGKQFKSDFEKWGYTVEQFRNEEGKLSGEKIADLPTTGDENKDNARARALSNYLGQLQSYEKSKPLLEKPAEVAKKAGEHVHGFGEYMTPTEKRKYKIQDRIDQLRDERGNVYAEALERGDLGMVIEQLINDEGVLKGDEEAAKKAIKLRKDFHRATAFRKATDDPEREKGMFKKLILSTLEMLVPLVKSGIKTTVPYVGQAWAFSEWASQGSGMLYAELEEAGVSHETARTIAPIGGAIYAGVEMAQFGQYTRAWTKGITKGVVDRTVKNVAKRILKTKGKDYFKEVSEEIVQEFVIEVGKEIGMQKEGISPKGAEEFGRFLWDASVKSLQAGGHAAVPIGVLTAFGIGGATIGAAYEGGIQKRKEVTRAVGEELIKISEKEAVTKKEKLWEDFKTDFAKMTEEEQDEALVGLTEEQKEDLLPAPPEPAEIEVKAEKPEYDILEPEEKVLTEEEVEAIEVGKVETKPEKITGYRSKAVYGEGYRDIKEVVTHEIEELGNEDVIDYLAENNLIPEKTKDAAYEYVTKLKEKGYDEVVWLSPTKEDVVKEYDVSEETVEKFDLEDAIVISDLEKQGKLVAYKSKVKEPAKVPKTEYKEVEAPTKKEINELTNLPGQNKSIEYVEEAITTDKFIFHFDIDDFKAINEEYSHGMGDDVLRKLGKAINRNFKDNSRGRIGGEEFVVIFDDAGEINKVEEFIKDINERLYIVDYDTGEKEPVTVSGGFAIGREGNALKADILGNRAKKAGKNQIIVDIPGKKEYNIKVPQRGERGYAKRYKEGVFIKEGREILKGEELTPEVRKSLTGALQKYEEERRSRLRKRKEVTPTQKFGYPATILSDPFLGGKGEKPKLTKEFQALSDEEQHAKLKEEKKIIDQQMSKLVKDGATTGFAKLQSLKARYTELQKKVTKAPEVKAVREEKQIGKYAATGEAKTVLAKRVQYDMDSFLTEIGKRPDIDIKELNELLEGNYTEDQLKKAIEAVKKGEEDGKPAKDIRKEIGEYFAAGTTPGDLLKMFEEPPKVSEPALFAKGKPVTFKKEVSEIKEKISPDLWRNIDITFAQKFGKAGKYSLGKGERGAIFRDGDKLRVVINPTITSKEAATTLVHEIMGHAGTANVMASNPAIYKRINSIYKTQKFTDRVKNIRKKYATEIAANPRFAEDIVFSEWIAYNMEDYIANPKKRGVAHHVWREIKKLLIGFGLAEDTVEDVMHQMAKEMKKVKFTGPIYAVKPGVEEPAKAKEIPPFEVDKEGKVNITNFDAISMDVWAKINSFMKRKGYDYRGAQDAKDLYKRQLGRRPFFGDQAEALKKAYKIGEYKPKELTTEQKESRKIARYFGITNDLNMGGYILPTGKLLDFSGRKQGNRFATGRALDHRDIGLPIEDKYGGTSGMQEYMAEGNIRMDFNSGMLDISKEPTKQQLKTIQRFVSETESPVRLGLANGLGELDRSGNYYYDKDKESLDYPEGTRPTKVLKDIDDYYKGEKPKPLTIAQRFHAPEEPLFAKREEAPAFYSPTEKAILELKQEKGVVPQIQSMIRKGQLKKAEVEWMGLEEWLAENPKATKSEILDFVRANEVEVEETALGETFDKEKSRIDERLSELDSIINLDEDATEAEKKKAEKEYDKLEKLYKEKYEGVGKTKFAQYTLPGGENYKELLFSMPPERIQPGKISYDNAKNLVKVGGQVKLFGSEAIISSLKELEQYPEDEIFERTEGLIRGDVFRGGHWEEHNVFAHARINERTTPEGEKVLFIEEIQSDWAREVREKGVKVATVEQANEAHKKYREYRDELQEKYDSAFIGKYATKEEVNKLSALLQKEVDLRQKTEGVPDFPFKKNWHEFVLKRLLRYAAENGFDRIAWTTGEQQAERYDLSKQVDEVIYERNTGGDYNLIVRKDGMNVITETSLPENKVADFIGKEPAKRLLESEEKTDRMGTYRSIKGEKLKIGGEWAINLYDRMIPKFLDKYSKKWQTKVEPTNLKDVATVQDKEGKEVWQGKVEDMPKLEEGEKIVYPYQQKSLPITPEMKETVITEGQPMFAKDLTPEQADLGHVKKLEKEVRKLRGKLIHISEGYMVQRANISLQIKELKEESTQIVRNLIWDYAKKIGLRGEAYNRVDTLIKNAKTARYFEKAVEIMDDVIRKRERWTLLTKVRKSIRAENKRLRAITGKRVPTVSYQQNKRLREYIDTLQDVSPDTFNRLQETLNYFDNNPDEEIPADVKKQIINIYRPNLREMDNAQLTQVLRDIEQIKKVGRLKRELDAIQRKRKIAQEAGTAAEDIRKVTKKPPESALKRATKRGYALKKFEALENLGKKFGWSHVRPERIIEWFTGFQKSSFKTQVFNKALVAEKKQLLGMETVYNRFQNIHKDLNLAEAVNKSYMEFEFDSVDENTGKKRTETINLTLDQMMFIYANSQNPGNLAHLLGTGVDMGLVDEVTAKLPTEYKDTVDKMIDYYDEIQYHRMNEVFKREHEIDMPHQHRYFPILNLKTDRAENQMMIDMLARYSANRASVTKGMTKSRVQSKAAYRKMSYFDTVIQNLKSSEHYIAYNDAIRDISQYINNPELRSAMEARSEEATFQIKDWVKAIAYGKSRKTTNVIDKLSDWLRTNYMTSVLGFNLITMAKQPASFSQGLARVNKVSATLSAWKFLQNPFELNRFVNAKSPMMKNRGQSFERELAEMAEKSEYKKQLDTMSILGKLKDFSMQGIRAADKSTTLILWYAKYSEIMNSSGNEDYAIQSADEVIRKTQPMGGVAHLPSIYRGGGISRAYTMFTNQLNQNLNLVFEMQQTWGQTKAVEKAAQTVFYMIIPSMIIYMASHGGRLPWKDPEGWARAFVNNVTGGLMLLNKLIEAGTLMITNRIKEARLGKADKRKLEYALDFAPTSFGALEDLGMGIGRGDPERLFDSMMKFTGTPYVAAKRAWRGVKKVKETKDPRYLIWSKYALKDPSVRAQNVARFKKDAPTLDDKMMAYEYYNRLPLEKRKGFEKDVPGIGKKLRKLKKGLFGESVWKEDTKGFVKRGGAENNFEKREDNLKDRLKKKKITEDEYNKRMKKIDNEREKFRRWKERLSE